MTDAVSGLSETQARFEQAGEFVAIVEIMDSDEQVDRAWLAIQIGEALRPLVRKVPSLSFKVDVRDVERT